MRTKDNATTPYRQPTMRPLTTSCRSRLVSMLRSRDGWQLGGAGQARREKNVRRASQVDGPEPCAHALARAVLQRHNRIDADLRPALVDRLDDVAVLFGDHAAADLARARQLTVVGVEFLVEEQEL